MKKFKGFYISLIIFIVSCICFIICATSRPEGTEELSNVAVTFASLSLFAIFLSFIFTIVFLIIDIRKSAKETRENAFIKEMNAVPTFDKGKKYCPHCSTPNSLESEYCSSCGTKLPTVEPEKPLYESDSKTGISFSDMLYILVSSYPGTQIILLIFAFIIGFVIGYFNSLTSWSMLTRIGFGAAIGVGAILLWILIVVLYYFIITKSTKKNISNIHTSIYEDRMVVTSELKKKSITVPPSDCLVFKDAFKAKERKNKLYIHHMNGKLDMVTVVTKDENSASYSFVRKKIEKVLK